MIVSDSGWVGKNLGRCYNQYTRTVHFDPGAAPADIDNKIKEIKSKMYGQGQRVEFSYLNNDKSNGVVATFTDLVDSGD